MDSSTTSATNTGIDSQSNGAYPRPVKKTKHRNGLEIGWAGYFFVYDGCGDEQSDYRAYVEAQGFEFAQVTPANVLIRTPAQQLMWDPADTDNMKFVLSRTAERWLIANVGKRGPDWYARKEPFDLFFQSILFRRRKDALRFIEFVNSSLELKK